MSKHFLRATLGAALVAVAGLASASTTTTVDSVTNSYGGGYGADSGLVLSLGEAFTVSVDPNELWNNSWGLPGYWSNADGNNDNHQVMGSFWIGELVGQIGNGDLFAVGTNFQGTANAAGELKFFYWDSDAYNNVGAVHAVVSVPEPESAALMGLGLLALAGLARRRRV